MTPQTPITVGHVGWSPDYKTPKMPPATGTLIARRSAAACSPSSGGQEPEQEKCGTTHYAGCACHEQGWENKWKAAIEMAARAQVERDAAIRVLESIEEIYIDGCDTYEDWKAMGEAARNFLYPENAIGHAPGEKGTANE